MNYNALLSPNFRSFLFLESKVYLGQRSGDILTALQNLNDDAAGMGNRALTRACTGIVNQIRRVLHGRWDEEDIKYLKKLQKVGVAIMKGIDEDEEMAEIIASSVKELEDLLDKLQMPINSLGTEDTNTDNDEIQPQSEKPEPLSRGSELSAN